MKQRLSEIRRVRRVQILRSRIRGAELELAAGRIEAGIVAVVAQFRDGPGWSVNISGAQVTRIHDHLTLVQRMVGTTSWDHVSWVVKRRHVILILRVQLKSALISHRQGAFRQRGKLRLVGRVTVSHLHAVRDGTERVLEIGTAVQRSRTPKELGAVGLFAVAKAEVCQDAFATALSLKLSFRKIEIKEENKEFPFFPIFKIF